MMVDFFVIVKWFNVFVCYDWLLFDWWGDWWLQGECVMYSGLIVFINWQYGCDELGCWFL